MIKIAEEALGESLNGYYRGKVEETASNMVGSLNKEKWSMALVKMLLMAIHRAREIRGELQQLDGD